MFAVISWVPLAGASSLDVRDGPNAARQSAARAYARFGRVRAGYDDYHIRVRERAMPSLPVGVTWDARSFQYFNRR
jgi:hypothetical protein